MLPCRYGDDAGQAAEESLASTGHVIEAGWSLYKIPRAFTTKGVVKAAHRQIVEGSANEKANGAVAIMPIE